MVNKLNSFRQLIYRENEGILKQLQITLDILKIVPTFFLSFQQMVAMWPETDRAAGSTVIISDFSNCLFFWTL